MVLSFLFDHLNHIVNRNLFIRYMLDGLIIGISRTTYHFCHMFIYFHVDLNKYNIVVLGNKKIK